MLHWLATLASSSASIWLWAYFKSANFSAERFFEADHTMTAADFVSVKSVPPVPGCKPESRKPWRETTCPSWTSCAHVNSRYVLGEIGAPCADPAQGLSN